MSRDYQEQFLNEQIAEYQQLIIEVEDPTAVLALLRA